VESREGNTNSAFAILRPFARAESSALRPLGFLLRVDEIDDLELDLDRRAVIAGLLWELNRRTSVALDYQENTVRRAPAGTAPATLAPLDSRTWYLHVVANF
jgi:hypothetical protein